VTLRYSIREGLAWVEGSDGGFPDRTVWIADVRTGDTYCLDGAGWLIWILLHEGATGSADIRQSAFAEGAGAAVAGVDLDKFLDELLDRRLLVASSRHG
jgi:hypothetical protein